MSYPDEIHCPGKKAIMADAPKIPLYGVILAGGWGTRFWPLSRSQYPKQVLRLLGSESMLQSTVERLLPRIPANRLAVSGDYEGYAKEYVQQQYAVLAQAQDWFEREPRLEMFAIPADVFCPVHGRD